MYSPKNTPRGYFEVHDGKRWVRMSLEELARELKVDFGVNALSVYNEIVEAGVRGRANNARTRRPVHFIPM